MSNTSSITQWLDHLIDLLPPSAIRLVGAGNGSGIWAQWLAAHGQVAASLVEANPQQFAALQRQQAAGNWPQASLLNTVIAPTAGEVDFFTASLTAESGLLPAEDLRAVWPNVHTVAMDRRAATDLAALLQVDAEPSADQQWLLLDCLPAAPLLQSAQEQLQHVDVVVARLLQAVDSTPRLSGMGASLEDVTKALPGFRLLALQPTRHPSLAHALFVRDYRSVVRQVQADLTKITQARDAEAKARQAALLAQADLQAQLIKVQTENAEALKKLDQQTLLADSFKQQKIELDVLLKKQADELIRVRKFLDASFKKEIANATRQIEASTCLQKYFDTGELPYINTEGHSWPISPDFALYLIELLEFNDYDLIIEFGSGISTSIIAKTLEKIATRRVGRLAVDFVSFDHLEKYYQKTHAQLSHAGLAHAVQLTLAPLKEWLAPNGITYSYYDCQSVLAELAKKHSVAGLRMLVLVDGPPAATGKHARYPAGPLILEHFAGAHIDLLLDDYIREDEKEIAKLWQDDIIATKLAYTVNERKLEKDAYLITVGSTKENS